MRSVRLGIVTLYCWWLTGCVTTLQVQDAGDELPLYDALFDGHSEVEVVSDKEIFALSEEAKAFVDAHISDHKNYETNISNLVYAIFDRAEMGLLYKGDANSIARNTFLNRAANCLSLSIMTYAMADYAGFDAWFYEVDIPEYWTRRDGFSLLNGHINLRITTPMELEITRLKDDFVDVDFDPQTIRKHFPRNRIKKDLVVAMFYNNRGADAILKHDYDEAYAYFKAAANRAPQLAQTWINLGVLYRFKQAYDEAERSYHYALAIDEDNLTGWENLAVLYRHNGQAEKAREIMASVDSQRRNNPFYHFILGEQALYEEKYAKAIQHYKQAKRLKKHHEIMFGLGKTYFAMGDISRARHYLEQAARYASNHQDEKRYESKLTMLQSSR
ncbi:tetratricopeptide repeat protein [Alteromonas halophila]|uniref:Tetratricopeptide repeat protein n=1 Tax=Alteromonas halophila TaxID=516698 RepID=A0A918JRC6_9ALTE|nr:tetratricopeptide repeat protein [Alteromonas halophila]GGW92212.1 hypothetical protein GCM10007391_28160 [Alteromonas halophila]